MSEQATTARETSPVARGCPGLVRGMEGRAGERLGHVLTRRSRSTRAALRSAAAVQRTQRKPCWPRVRSYPVIQTFSGTPGGAFHWSWAALGRGEGLAGCGALCRPWRLYPPSNWYAKGLTLVRVPTKFANFTETNLRVPDRVHRLHRHRRRPIAMASSLASFWSPDQ